MGKFAKHIRNVLNGIIDDAAEHAELFVSKPGHDHTRSRKMNFAETIRQIMCMGPKSLNHELYEAFKKKGMSITASAFVQQRDKIDADAFSFIMNMLNRECNDTKLFMGRRLLAVDGTVVTYNGYEEDDTYMEHIDTNQYHVNVLYDLMNKTYTDTLIQPNPQMNEQKAAWQMMERTPASDHPVLIGDRGYGGINLIEHINRIKGADYLFRIKNGLWKEMRDLPMTDLDTDITIRLRTTQTNEDKEAFASGDAKWVPGHGKYKELKDTTWDFESPYSVTVRIVRFKITDDTYETIATSLSREEFPPDVLKYLYHLRWGIETSFREIKYCLDMICFHARKTNSIMQEIYAAVIMYNFCQRLTLSVVISIGKRKHEYQVNFSMGIHICMDFFREGIPIEPELEIEKYILPVRPGRTDKRKMVKTKSAVTFNYRFV